jgi:hypothetical protein
VPTARTCHNRVGKGDPVQPQINYAPSATRSPSRTAAVLAIVASACVLLGWYLPYVSFAGRSASMSDDSSNIELAVLGPAVVGIIAGIVGLRGQRFGSALATGAAAGVSTMCLVFVAAVYEVVSEAGDFGLGGDYSYNVGFFLHVVAAVAAMLAALMSFAMLQEAARQEDKSVNPSIATLGAIGVAASALGFLLPDNGFSIFDIPSVPIKGAYLTFIGVFAIVGIVGFASGRPTGAALGAGAAVTPLLVWVADAMNEQEYGSGFFGGINDGNTALVALGAAAGVIFGVAGMASAGAGARRAGSVPASAPSGGWGSAVPEPLITPVPSAVPAATAPAAPSVPAGWHPDPVGRHEQRYWDGATWTSHVADAGAVGSDPL